MAEKQETNLAVLLQSHRKELMGIAPKYVNVTRMMALALEATMRNPLLKESSIDSVLNFCKKCAEAGTDRIGAGGMWAVPFKNGKTGKYDMTPIPDWRLIVEKAKKAKAIKHATAVAVYEGDTFSYEYGLEPKMTHIPTQGKKGNLTAVYCVYTLPDDTKEFVVMSWAEIEGIRDRTNAWKSHLKYKTDNPWVTDPAEQAKKTVIKRALKIFEGASPELTMLIGADNAVMGFPELTLPEPIAEPKAIDTPATTLPAEEKTADKGEIPAGKEESAGEPPAPPKPPAVSPSKPGNPATGAQTRYILKLLDGLNPELADHFAWKYNYPAIDKMTKKQASEFIAWLATPENSAEIKQTKADLLKEAENETK